ncbi:MULTISPECIES: flagellin [Thalassospira]|jgi:flagellin|uniref:flagellin N-terminal helical domain-containing protein n=2 Tax=Thalassospiraceae TaxID=2844866 RepID=UPI000EC8AE73|nr:MULTISPECIES: flagellin [Thalassospira]MBO6809034.1 flagellin [Thalassospira sp.]MBO6841940.1 flagellin [Thalassospira sp.]MBS8274651.1 flagellin [Thalassospira tepidiphila]HAI28494.1 flagellin [Thalassospira sp.]
MALNIISNYAANVAHRNLTASDTMATRSLAKLSSGTRVVSARDDAASMAIGARLNATTESLKTATVNVNQANSMLQIADGGMATIDNILVRMKTLAVQASSGNLSDTERGFLNDEFVQLRDEIDRIASSTNFNGIQLLGDGGDVALEFGDLASGAGGAALVPATGFDAFAITDNNYWATDTDTDLTDNNFSVDINELASGQIIMTVTSTIDGATDRSQSIDVSDYASGGTTAISAGENATLNFDELGLSFTVNTNFSATVTEVGAGTGGSQDFGSDTAFTAANVDTTNNTVTMAADNGQQLQQSVDFQVGAGNTANDRLAIEFTAVDSETLGSGSNGTQDSIADLTANAIDTAANAQNAVEVVSRAIDDLQRARANIGTYQNRLDFAGQNLASTQENTESARSTLLDLDVAAEMTNFTSKQILVQSGVAMLAQANQMPQNLLRLLQG